MLADTHVPDFARSLPAEVMAAVRSADMVLHAGDVTSSALLDGLAAFAPVRVAMGNRDGPDVAAWGAEPEVHLDVEGVRIAMLHDSGRSAGRRARMARRFPDAGVVVYGHSHIPMDAEADGRRLFNPGSPTWKRRQPLPTYGVLDVADGRVRSRIVEIVR